MKGSLLLLSALAVGLAPEAHGQAFVINTADIPAGGTPFNDSVTENIDFADVDLDGDWDAAFADGGDAGNDQNRIWMNEGPANVGVFVDETNLRFPSFEDTSRDIEFVDFDNDGDADIYTSNSAQAVNQSNRWWVNQGSGSGLYLDETQARWADLGVNDGVTKFSSISQSAVLASGGFIDWSCDCDFGDLDNDGDLDLVHSTYGGAFNGNVPTRVFLNDGTGVFREFNPSGVQLTGSTIPNGTPALWVEGVQQHGTQMTDGSEADIADTTLDLDIGDLDGDLDLDILHGARNQVPRLFQNRLEENGGQLTAFRDITYASFVEFATGGNNYEQEMGDIDGDGDLDIYGLNWAGFEDIITKNDGTGNFGPFTILAASNIDDTEGDFIDYDNDGDLDLFIANFSGQNRLYRNVGGGSYVNVTSSQLPADTKTALDADISDVDNDGDYDLFVATQFGGNVNDYYENVTQVPDTTAPSLTRLEQAPNRESGANPTVVRVQVYDNAAYYVTWYNQSWLEVTVDGGPVQVFPLQSSGGQIFRGEIPGNLEGTICYQAFSMDAYGNTGQSAILCYDAGGPVVYCTAKTSSAGCVTLISTSSANLPVSGANDYSVLALSVQGMKNGLLFAGLAGPATIPFWGGTLCVAPPLKRGPISNSSGSSPTSCDGSYSVIVNGSVIPFGLDAGPGNTGWYQWWYRDPQNGSASFGSALSDALQLQFL